MSNILETLPPQLFSNKDCFPMGVTYPLSLVNKYFYQLLTSTDHYRDYWQQIVTASDFLYAEARISCLYCKNQDNYFTLIDLQVIDLRERKVVKATRRDIRTNFETIRQICAKLTQATEAAFFKQTGKFARSFFYQNNLKHVRKSLYRMALEDYNNIEKPGVSLKNLNLSVFLKAIMEERLPLDVVLSLIHLQVSFLTVKTHKEYLCFNFKDTALLLFTLDDVLNHPLYKTNPHDILHILLLLLEIVLITRQNTADPSFKKIVEETTSYHLSIIEHLHRNHSFTFQEIILLLEWNLNNHAQALSFHCFINFISALNQGFISSTKIKAKINKRLPPSFKYYTDQYLQCLQLNLMKPKDQIALNNHILDNNLNNYSPHPLASLYIDFLTTLKNRKNMEDPMHPHIKNIVDLFFDAFLLKIHEPSLEENIPQWIQSYRDTIPFQWHFKQDLTAETLCTFYQRIRNTLQAAIECTPSFHNKEMFINLFLLKKKNLYILMSSIMHSFIETQSDKTDGFGSFDKTTDVFIKMFESRLNDTLTSELTKHFAQKYLRQMPKKQSLSFEELTDQRLVTSCIAPILYARDLSFHTKANITNASFEANIEILLGLIEQFLTDAVPKLQCLTHNQGDIFQSTTRLLIQQYHNYLLYYFCNLEQNGLEIVLSIHQTLITSINDRSFFTHYITYIAYLHHHLGIQKILNITDPKLHLLLITFIKLHYFLKNQKIEANHFEQVLTLLDARREKTITTQFIDLEHIIFDFFTDTMFLDLYYNKKESADWLKYHIDMINIFFPLPIEETNPDIEIDEEFEY